MSSETKIPRPACQRIEPLLDDLVDGQLSGDQQGDVRRHLAVCEACAEKLGRLEALLEQAAALPRHLDLPADLWPAIEPRLGARPLRPATGGRWPSWARQALAALLFMTLGALLSQILLPGGKTVPASAVDIASAAAGRPVERRADFALAEADYLRAKESLWAAVYAGREAASPEIREVVERNLLVIDRAIRELRQALQADPGNPQLENLLLTQHRTEIDLLQRLALPTSEI